MEQAAKNLQEDLTHSYEMMQTSCVVTSHHIIDKKDQVVFQNISEEELVVLDDKLGISLDEADFDEILMCVPQLQTSVMSHKKNTLLVT